MTDITPSAEIMKSLEPELERMCRVVERMNNEAESLLTITERALEAQDEGQR